MGGQITGSRLPSNSVSSWSEIETEAAELAALARRIFDAHIHKTIATLRRDGSPRISGIETNFRDGELYLGSMRPAVKALDLRRDPRFALHSASSEKMDPGDAKLSGTVEEIADPAQVREVNGTEPGESHLFRADIDELVVTRVQDKKLVIESWHPGRGVERRER
jgi:hypothetical protein